MVLIDIIVYLPNKYIYYRKKLYHRYFMKKEAKTPIDNGHKLPPCYDFLSESVENRVKIQTNQTPTLFLAPYLFYILFSV
ncbi:hypothetical protein ES702_01272 [subsurface metagenome]